jgi:hypothetical protein
MITKGIVQRVDRRGNQFIVRVPLFESASTVNPVSLKAYQCIVPGLYNNLYVGDIVYIGFEENAMEKPIILGKFFKNYRTEDKAKGGSGNFTKLNILDKASMPASTTRFRYTANLETKYDKFNTPHKLADRIKENIIAINRLRLYVQPWNMRVDDGDLDAPSSLTALDSQYNRSVSGIDTTDSLFMSDFLYELYKNAPERPDDVNDKVFEVTTALNKSYRIEDTLKNLKK